MLAATKLVCRFCKHPGLEVFVDLGVTPLANSYLHAEQLLETEPVFPLTVRICKKCLLVQADLAVSAETIFSDYAYFSSFSQSWLEHCKKYAEKIITRLKLDNTKFVVEVASNDGHLLKNFIKAGIPALGVEPAVNVANEAIKNNVPTDINFFGVITAKKMASENKYADLMVANNVLAHVPDINDFVAGFKILLKPEGVATFEFPHIVNLILRGEFDTIYHEHFYYYSLFTVEKLFAAHGLRIFDVEKLPTHGGSLRIYVCHEDSSHQPVNKHLKRVHTLESKTQLNVLKGYLNFKDLIQAIKNNLLDFLDTTNRLGKTVVAYGAAAKGNTLFNFCGINTTHIEYVVDLNPHKQGLYLPGSHIPIYEPGEIFATKPDYVLILPWNITREVKDQMQNISAWGGKFVTAIPALKIWEH